MLAVPADRLPDAIGDLDPGNRALLDLSLRRGVSDAEIGELLRKQPADVARGRDAVLELLADALEVNGHDRRERVRQAVAALPDDAWQVRAPAPPPRPRPAEPEPEPDAEEEDELPDRERDRAAAARELDDDLYFEPEERRSRRGALMAVLGLAVVIVALIVVLSSGGDDDDDSGTSQGNGSQPAQDGGSGPQSKGNSQKLTPLGNAKGRGTVTVTDEGATVVVRGLPKPDGSYQVWLYNDIVDAQSLGTISGGSGKLEVKLPPEASDYKSVDVSNEPSDANPNHSGASVLRAPLGGLLNE